MSWEIRLKIATETAEQLSYLHFAASPPIINRDVKSSNISLDNTHIVKFFDLGASKFIPLDQTQLDTVVNFGILRP